MTSREIATKYHNNPSTVRNWAAANGVAFNGEGSRKTFIWTEADVERFLSREKAGRPSKDSIREKPAKAKSTAEDQVKKITHDLEVRVGKGYRVAYAGKLEWKIHPV
jgi:hypothetical protein